VKAHERSSQSLEKNRRMNQQLTELQLEASRIKKGFLQLESSNTFSEWLKNNMKEMKSEWAQNVHQIHKKKLEDALKVESNRYQAQLAALKKRLEKSDKETQALETEKKALSVENLKIKSDIVNVQSGLKGIHIYRGVR
jgi:DNA anti-recombination protein RmuC